MKIEEQILINKFGQDLLSFQELLSYFKKLDIKKKRKFLSDLSFLIMQTKPLNDDIDRAIELGKLKPTFTPCVKIKKGLNSQIFKEIIDLPENEIEKSFVLLLSLYKILEKEKNNPYKWWFQDLSNSDFEERIKTLSNLKLIIHKLYNDKGKETGAIISAFIPFKINLYEKNIVERHLELYAFNNLYPNTGLNLFKEINDDIASLTVIKGINDLPYEEERISIY